MTFATQIFPREMVHSAEEIAQIPARSIQLDPIGEHHVCLSFMVVITHMSSD